MNDTDDSAGAEDRLTILRPLGRQQLAKAYSVAPNGQVVKRDWADVKVFSAETVPVASVHDLLRELRRIEPDARACVIRGEPVAGADMSATRRKKVENGGAFEDVPRRFLMLDLDKVKLPAGASVIDDPADAARVIVDLVAAHVPELQDVTAIVQFSSSAGIEDLAEAEAAAGLPARWDGVVKRGAGVGAHVWYWLDTPANGAELDRWAKAANARIGHKFIDPATLRTVQVHYTAGPVFGETLRDPLPGRRTLLIEGEADAATLVIPEVAARPAYEPASSANAGRGYLGWLDAIGGPDGFNTPIMGAVASFVSANWPSPDGEALADDIAARVLAADPGSRSQSEIERYADRGQIEARFKWAMEREEANRAAKAVAAATAAETSIAPTYPDRGVTLGEANRLAAEAIARFSARIAAGEVPQLLLRVTVGGGKTFSAIDALPALLAAGRDAGRGPVLFTHPRHALGDQIAADIARHHPTLRVAVWRGMEADNPDQPGEKMCRDPELPRAAKAAGQGATHGCPACPLRDGCAYHDQTSAARKAEVLVAPHQVLSMMPFAAWPRVTVDGKKVPVPPSAIIVDEDVTSACVAGLNPLAPVQLALSALASTETPNVSGYDRDRLLDLRRRGLAAIEAMQAGPLFRDPLVEAGFDEIPDSTGIGTLNAAKEWAAAEWECKPRIKVNRGTTRSEALAAYEAAAEQRFTPLRAKLAERIADFLVAEDARSVALTLVPDAELGRNQGTGPAVRFAWRQDFHPAWTAPLLFLDATGRAEVLRYWAPDLETADIEVKAPHQHVVQVADRAFSRAMLATPGNASRLADLVMVEVAKAWGPVLAVCQVVPERLLRQQLEARGGVRDPLADGGDEDDPATYRFPSGAVLHLAHHGDITGSNAWQDVATVIVVGRPATNLQTGERLAEVIAGRAVGIAAAADKSQWPAIAAGIRMADGTGRLIDQQPQHSDPLVEAVRWSITEGAVLQAIGRARGVRRTTDNPARVVLLAGMALPLTVDEVMTWDAILPDRLTVAAAEAALFGRAMPLAPADMSEARRDLWETVKAAERFMEGWRRFETPQSLIRLTYKGLGGFKTHTGARYRKGLRGRWSAALVPIDGGEDALEAMVGPVAAYELAAGDAAGRNASAQAPARDAPAREVRTHSAPDPRTREAAADPEPMEAAEMNDMDDAALDALPEQAGIPPGMALAPADGAGGLGFEDVLTASPGHRLETLGVAGHGGGMLSRPAPSGRMFLWGEAPPILWMLSPPRRPTQPPPPAGLFVLGADPPFFPALRAAPPPPAMPMRAVPPVPMADQRGRLAALARRLEESRPPKLAGDFTDFFRIEAWQARLAAAQARRIGGGMNDAAQAVGGGWSV